MHDLDTLNQKRIFRWYFFREHFCLDSLDEIENQIDLDNECCEVTVLRNSFYTPATNNNEPYKVHFLCKVRCHWSTYYLSKI